MAVAIVGAGATIALSGLIIAADSSLLRVAIAVLVVGALALVSVLRAQTAVVMTICCLPFLALARRMLIPVAGWTSWDALLIIAPVVSLILAHRAFVLERRPLANDPLSKLVGAVLLLSLLESVNPAGGSLSAGIVGLLYAAAPLAWFFIGRELADERLVNIVLTSTVVVGVAVALYGLWQTTVGLPSWDAEWANVTGYAALSVGGATRAFGSFSSSAEYGTFVGIAFVVAFVAVLHGRLIALTALPVLGIALFLESSRGIVVLVLAGVVMVMGMRTGRVTVTLACSALALGAAGLIITVYGPQLTDAAQHSGNPFVAHQVAGLLNPFDPNQSSLTTHQSMVSTGVGASFGHPLGLGLAAINPQGARFAATATAATELDISNAFVALGPLGGVLFLAVVILTLVQTSRLALLQTKLAGLALVGLLAAALGQWLNGGYYAVAPLLWLLVGWANHEWVSHRSVAKPDEHPQARAAAWPTPATGW